MKVWRRRTRGRESERAYSVLAQRIRVLNTDQGKHKGSTDDWRAVQPIRELKTSHHKNLYFFEVTALIGFKTKTVIKEIKQMRQFY